MIIFTDLDGTLLDEASKSYAPAMPAIRLVGERGIPLIFCSSKTRAEIEHYREKLGNRYPFIVENGGAIFIPEGYFDFPYPHSFLYGSYRVLQLGAPYDRLRTILKGIERESGFILKGFGDMSVEEVAELTRLPREEAELAKQREYDEPFIIESGQESDVIEAIHRKGYHVTRAQFLHILGNSDKGKAVARMKGLFRMKMHDITTVALGDSPNDIPMLEQVEIPIIVQKADGSYDPRISMHRLKKAQGVGPEGWNSAIRELLSQ